MCWARWVKVFSTPQGAPNPLPSASAWRPRSRLLQPVHCCGCLQGCVASEQCLCGAGVGFFQPDLLPSTPWELRNGVPAPSRNTLSLSQQVVHPEGRLPGEVRHPVSCHPQTWARAAGLCSSPPWRDSGCQVGYLFTCYKCRHLRHPSPSNCLGTR